MGDTVSHITKEIVYGVRCDHRGCTATVEGPPLDGHYARHRYEALAETYGWTIWSARSRELRCPNHPMRRPGKYTHRVTEAAADEAYNPRCPEDCPCRLLPALRTRIANLEETQ